MTTDNEDKKNENVATTPETGTPATTSPEAGAAASTPPAEASATTGQVAVGEGSEAPAAITVSIEGAFTDKYVGPPGLTFKQMFPVLAQKNYQLREVGKMVGQSQPWMRDAVVKANEHAVHG